MPELPEVHTISQDLNTHISGYVITDVKVSEGYHAIPDPTDFSNRLKGRTVLKVYRIAKNIVISLDSGESLVVHLAMTGRMLLRDTTVEKDLWVRFALALKNQESKKLLKFTDMRMFGRVMVADKLQLDKLSGKYGDEPLSQEVTPQKFLEALHKKRTTIKNALLDQTIVSGLGNIYATDALFIAKVHPETNTAKITLDQAKNLLQASKDILLEGISHRGSTLPDKMYVDIFGKEGTQQNHFKIYMKKNCPTCNSKVDVKKINGRSTYFCSTCQIASHV